MHRFVVRLADLASRLGSGRARLLLVALGVALALPSIGSRFVLDDNTHALLQRADPGVVGHDAGVFDLFVFSGGRPEVVRAMVNEGVLAWWTFDEFKNAFWRPLSSLTHAIDGAWWPASAVWMHVHTIAWYGVLLVAASWVYRRLLTPSWVAGLGLLLYAVDDAHGHTIGWNANRNAAVATCFALTALALHDRWRRDGRRLDAPLASIAFALALLAGEIAVGLVGYLVAYAVFVDRMTWHARVVSLAPYGFVLGAWRAVYARLGYGSYGSDAYLDPGAEPLAFAVALPKRFAMLMMGQFGAPAADLGFWGPPDARWLLWLPAAFTIVATLAFVWPSVRDHRECRFWGLGAVLAAVPVCASFSSDRHLLLVGVGSMALLARAFAGVLGRAREGSVSRPMVVVAAGFAVLHLVVAPLLFPVRARTWEVLGRALDRAEASLPSDASVRDKTVIIVNVPVEPFASWLHVMRERRGVPRPAHIYSLAVASSPIEVTRVAGDVLDVRPARGYLYSEPERLLRSTRHPFRQGDRIELAGVTAVIGPLNGEGQPESVRFRFHEPMNSGRYVFVRWTDGVYEPFPLPSTSQSETFRAEDLMQIVIGAAAR